MISCSSNSLDIWRACPTLLVENSVALLFQGFRRRNPQPKNCDTSLDYRLHSGLQSSQKGKITVNVHDSAHRPPSFPPFEFSSQYPSSSSPAVLVLTLPRCLSCTTPRPISCPTPPSIPRSTVCSASLLSIAPFLALTLCSLAFCASWVRSKLVMVLRWEPTERSPRCCRDGGRGSSCPFPSWWNDQCSGRRLGAPKGGRSCGRGYDVELKIDR